MTWTGKRNDEASGTLLWRLTDEEFKHVRVYHPKIKLYCYYTKLLRDPRFEFDVPFVERRHAPRARSGGLPARHRRAENREGGLAV